MTSLCSPRIVGVINKVMKDSDFDYDYFYYVGQDIAMHSEYDELSDLERNAMFEDSCIRDENWYQMSKDEFPF